jgi:hypothetical protein
MSKRHLEISSSKNSDGYKVMRLEKENLANEKL